MYCCQVTLRERPREYFKVRPETFLYFGQRKGVLSSTQEDFALLQEELKEIIRYFGL